MGDLLTPRKRGYSILEATLPKAKAKPKLRKQEYHPALQVVRDGLYAKSKDGIKFHSLMPMITSYSNITLAIRNIKGNHGSKTAGTNSTTIQDILDKPINDIVAYVRERLNYYVPTDIRRVYIPKANGKERPLGIPNIEERLLQQCILQILEPIAEAKFITHSYGFRPLRSVQDAQFRAFHLINASDKYFVVDMDIKGFFDNVNHSKLIKQLWTLGIRDQKLLTIIRLMLKAKVVEPSFERWIPEKGTPQGGILSPLLANIALNELDHWIVEQWEEFKSQDKYASKGNMHTALKKTNLKQMYYVRYADDFRIFTDSYENAQKIYHAVFDWLKERLKLEISEEKSRIIDIRKNAMKFLGLTFKAVPNHARRSYKRQEAKKKISMINRKSNDLTCQTSVSAERIKDIESDIKDRTRAIKRQGDHIKRYKAIMNYNAYIRGLRFYSYSTYWSDVSRQLEWNTRKFRYNRLRTVVKTQLRIRGNRTVEGLGVTKRNRANIQGLDLMKPTDIKHTDYVYFKPDICPYTVKGRSLVHQDLIVSPASILMAYMETRPIANETAAYNINRIAAVSRQKGICAISGTPLTVINFHVHHAIPIEQGGTEETKNLIVTTISAHRLIHAVKVDTIQRIYSEVVKEYGPGLKPKSVVTKLNRYREKVGLTPVTLKILQGQ